MATNLRSFPAMRQARLWIIPNQLPRHTFPATLQLFSTHCRRSHEHSPSEKSPQNSPSNSIPSTNSNFKIPALTHLNESGDAHMVSISSKEVTPRTATAVCKVEFSNPLAATLIRENRSNKGDVFAVARVAGIMAAKRTVDLIPLCHPVPISRVAIFLQLRRWTPKVAPVGKNSPVGESGQAEALQKSQSWPGTGQGDSYQLQLNTMSTPEGDQDTSQQGTTQYTEPRQEGSQVQQRANGTERSWVDITATVECEGKTGVEMEAMTAASVAALTVYDMCKAVDKRMRIGDLRVTYKAGGKSGTWVDGISVGRTTKSGFNAGANTYSP